MASKLSRLFGKGQSEGLPPYGYRYLDHVLGDLTATVKAEDTLPSYVGDIRTRAETARKERIEGLPDGQRGTNLSWSDIHILERYLLSRETVETLRRRAWFLRLKYREVLGQRAYDAYTASQPPNDIDATETILRADLERLLSALHRSYTLLPLREQMRTGVIRAIGKWLLIVVLVLIPFLVFFANRGQSMIATTLLVALAGAAGGFMSLQQRIQRVPTDGDPLISIFELQNGLASIYLAPISGAVFAVLLFLVFMAKLVEGAIFPSVEAIALTLKPFWPLWPETYANYALDIGQPRTQAFAKLLVWSFIAGFAERFVPDTLTRLVERSNAREGTPLPAPPVVPGTTTSDGVSGADLAKEAEPSEDGRSKDETTPAVNAPSGSTGQGEANVPADTAEPPVGKPAAPDGAGETDRREPVSPVGGTPATETTTVGESTELTPKPGSSTGG